MQHIRLDTIGSTNDYVRSLPPTPSMVLVTAEQQTAGRGQGTNRWVSAPRANLLFSLRLSPRALRADTAFVVSQAVALSLRTAAVEALHGVVPAERVSVKWPNDVYVDSRKLAGILIENTLRGEMVDSIIAGCGMNVNQTSWQGLPPEPVPVSIAMLTGREADIDGVLHTIMETFAAHMAAIDRGEYAAVRDAYRRVLYHGTGVHAFRCLRSGDCQGQLLQASIDDVAPSGMLTLRTTEGERLTFAFKEIAFVHH